MCRHERHTSGVPLPAVQVRHSDDDRVVELGEEDLEVLPDHGDDADTGWGAYHHDDHADRLWDERPPHWE